MLSHERLVKRLNKFPWKLKAFSQSSRKASERQSDMIASIDLKPLTDETIKQMGYNPLELWKVRIGKVVFGPFETESLRHYVSDNEHLFDHAEACLNNVHEDWKPFWAITKFTRRKPQTVSEDHPGPFWIMINGLPRGPFTFADIAGRIKASELVMTDHISTDEGETWKKVYEIRGFDRRAHKKQDLPATAPSAPSVERSIQTEPKASSNDMLAEMAFIGQQQGKVLQMKVEETSFHQDKDVETSDALKWAIPVAFTFIFCVVGTGYYYLQPDVDSEEDTVAETEIKPGQKSARKVPQGVMPDAGNRLPASTGYAQPREPQYSEPQISRYPTHIETHDQVLEEQPVNTEPREALTEPQIELEPQEQPKVVPQEHSLVDNNIPQEEQSLDAAMNGQEVQEKAEPQVREVQESGDF